MRDEGTRAGKNDEGGATPEDTDTVEQRSPRHKYPTPRDKPETGVGRR